jgi:hypothetical protein
LQKLKDYMESAKRIHEEHTALVGALFFVGGFLFDILTLGRIDDMTNIIFQAFYLFTSYAILLIVKRENFPNLPTWLNKILEFREDIFHFFVGGLLSSFTIFYFKSSSTGNSFIFLMAITAVLILNEIEFFQQLGITFKSILLKISSTSFLIYLIPLLLKTNHSGTFYLAIGISLGFTLVLTKLFLKYFDFSLEDIKKQFLWPRLTVLGFFMVFYWANILPPLPLSLTELGVYYKIEKKYPEYHLQSLKPWWKFWQGSNESFHYRPGDKVNLFFKVFSPGDFKEKVFIEWYRYDDNKGEWLRSDRIPLVVTGGREEGFRGITKKANYQEGEWRVIVRTENNLILGELDFDLIKDSGKEKREFKTVIDK